MNLKIIEIHLHQVLMQKTIIGGRLMNQKYKAKYLIGRMMDPME